MSNPGNVSTEYSDDLDGDVHYLLAKSKMNKSESSETETDSETDMHVIRPKPNRKLRHGSDRSYGRFFIDVVFVFLFFYKDSHGSGLHIAMDKNGLTLSTV